MKKIYYLKTCNTCSRIIKELNISSDFIFQEIKSEPITVDQLEGLKTIAGSYEVLFSKRAKLYKEMDLKNQKLEERDYKHYILEHYTFLSRPVVIIEDKIFIGNSKKTIEALRAVLIEKKISKINSNPL
ncbi:arsenate reductase family protein [uncultured Algibacter sp.]|uniref:arsenate reductase family protein n=1 Tax=uncultured Algibacter sp. TaxID=298659 RepID=UPI002617EAC2|nr:ArsC/Spx/MgsR family protein [uncultured Algibacter sp.]